MICGACGHASESHHGFGRGACGYRIPRESTDLVYDWRCKCTRFRTMESLLAQRVAVILLFVLVLGSLPRLVDLVVSV